MDYSLKKEILAQFQGLVLYPDGIAYEYGEPFPFNLFSLEPSKSGFIPIDQISAIAITRRRSRFWFYFSFFTIPIVVGIVILLLWIVFPINYVIVYSSGEPLLMIRSGSQYAATFVNTFRELKNRYLQPATS